MSTNQTSSPRSAKSSSRRTAVEWLDGKIEQAGKTFGAIFFIDEVERLREIRRLLTRRVKITRRRRRLKPEPAPGA